MTWRRHSRTPRGSFDRSIVLRELPLEKGVTIMGGKKDEIKGRIKEAAGALTGNDELRDEGKADQAVGKVEQVVEKAADAVKTVVKKVTG
jgi:uncharacterized protein YjbJ (UPF0337 family)